MQQASPAAKTPGTELSMFLQALGSVSTDGWAGQNNDAHATLKKGTAQQVEEPPYMAQIWVAPLRTYQLFQQLPASTAPQSMESWPSAVPTCSMDSYPADRLQLTALLHETTICCCSHTQNT